MSKKTRGPNFSSNEKEILIHLISKYKDVVENKKTDAVTTAMKNEGWRKLTEEFNSSSSFSIRNTEQLKTCWDNIKRNTRKDKAATKRETLRTGGGRPDLPPPGPFQGQVEILLGPTLDGLENEFDSDAQFTGQSKFEVLEVTTSVENEPTSPSPAGESKAIQDESLIIIPENEPSAGPSGVCKSREDENLIVISEEKEKPLWNGWSPAALKSKMSDSLSMKKKGSPSWLARRRPKTSLQDQLLQSKLDLVEEMKKNCESEAAMKQLILAEQLKQEKIKTEMLEIQLNKIKNGN